MHPSNQLQELVVDDDDDDDEEFSGNLNLNHVRVLKRSDKKKCEE